MLRAAGIAGIPLQNGLYAAAAGAILYAVFGTSLRTLRLARLKPGVRELLARDGILGRIGEENIHGNVDHAVEAQIAARGYGSQFTSPSGCGEDP